MSSEQITQETVPSRKDRNSIYRDTANTTTYSSTTEQPAVAKSWKEAISEEYRTDPNIEKFTEIDALAKSYINATRMIGQDKVVIPTNKFYRGSVERSV